MRLIRLVPAVVCAAAVAQREPSRAERLEAALNVRLQEVAVTPKSAAANSAAGSLLDLLGRYAEARTYFTQAIRVAGTPLEKAQAQRAMAISYAFSGDCRGAAKYDSAAREFFLSTGDFYNAGECADELGRICLESGDLDAALEWYRKGHDSGLQEENLPASRADLWDFRWAHARARIAARRGRPQEAAKYVAAAKAIAAKGTIPEQQIYLPYLEGYVAFYGGDYTGALAYLQAADPRDPMIECLMAQCYEKLGDAGNARAWYRRAAGTMAHSVPAAAARPFSMRRLQQLD